MAKQDVPGKPDKFKTKYEGVRFSFGGALESVKGKGRKERQSASTPEDLLSPPDDTERRDKLAEMEDQLVNFEPLEGKMKVYNSSQKKHLKQMFGDDAYMVTLKDYRFTNDEFNDHVLKKMVFFVVPDPRTGIYKAYTENMQQFYSNNVEKLVNLAAETHSRIATAKPRKDILLYDPGKGEEDLVEAPDQDALNTLGPDLEEYIQDQKGLSLTKQSKKGKNTPTYMLRFKNYQFEDDAGRRHTIKDKYFLVELDTTNQGYKSYYRGGEIYASSPEELVQVAADLATEKYDR